VKRERLQDDTETVRMIPQTGRIMLTAAAQLQLGYPVSLHQSARQIKSVIRRRKCMSENDLVVEFKEFLDDPIQQSWIQTYLEGDQEAKALVEAALKTLEEGSETEES